MIAFVSLPRYFPISLHVKIPATPGIVYGVLEKKPVKKHYHLNASTG